ncbi:MAG: hypothetical protein ACFCUG_09165 [Thiotrichales bacterium]
MSGKLLTGALLAPWMAGILILNAGDSTDGANDWNATSGQFEPPAHVGDSPQPPLAMRLIEARMQAHLSAEPKREQELQRFEALATPDHFAASAPSVPTRVATRVLWQPSQATPERMIERPQGYPEPLLRVSLDGLRLDTLRAGDELELPPLAGSSYRAVIDSVVRPLPGVTQVSATIEAFGTEGTVTLTQGEIHTFGTIATPSDTFELDAVGDHGEIFATRDLDRLIDYTKDDYLPIPDQRTPPASPLETISTSDA